MTVNTSLFSKALLAWYQQHGRRDLPWRRTITPYRVWVSEIMLQQTQVTTVIPYFQRFMQAFPTVAKLAQAEQDHVLHLWTGLGYYARARNLHRAAQQICQHYQGRLPDKLEDLVSLPGIGRSTAGAILAIAFGQQAVILDGNVRRVLCRLHRVAGWPGQAKVANQLWQLATDYTPAKQVNDYTQAIMDLGATLCTRSRPKCQQCPVQSLCQAYRHQQQQAYPQARPKNTLAVKQVKMLLLVTPDGEVLLVKRPNLGIWGGLWSLPECAVDEDLTEYCQRHWQLTPKTISHWPALRHSFSHFHLTIEPVQLVVEQPANWLMESCQQSWYKLAEPNRLGLAAPVKRLLNQLQRIAQTDQDSLCLI